MFQYNLKAHKEINFIITSILGIGLIKTLTKIYINFTSALRQRAENNIFGITNMKYDTIFDYNFLLM